MRGVDGSGCTEAAPVHVGRGGLWDGVGAGRGCPEGLHGLFHLIFFPPLPEDDGSYM